MSRSNYNINMTYNNLGIPDITTVTSNSSNSSTFQSYYKNPYDDYYKLTRITYDKNGKILEQTFYNEEVIDIKYKTILTPKKISRTRLVPTTEERLEGYIQDNYDRYIVQEYGTYIYQMIQEKAYDIASEIIEEAKDEYDIQDEDAVIEAIIEEIDFDSMYELVEDILHAPITMEEKLADVGMSIRDFL